MLDIVSIVFYLRPLASHVHFMKVFNESFHLSNTDIAYRRYIDPYDRLSVSYISTSIIVRYPLLSILRLPYHTGEKVTHPLRLSGWLSRKREGGARTPSDEASIETSLPESDQYNQVWYTGSPEDVQTVTTRFGARVL